MSSTLPPRRDGALPFKQAIIRGSDIDLTLIAPTMTPRQLLQLEQQIDNLLLPWKVDLSLHHEIDNPALREHIQRVGVPLNCPAAENRPA